MNTLKDAIAAYEVAKAEKVPADVLAIMNGATTGLIEAGIDKQALKTGDKIPAVELPNHKNEPQSLAKHLEDSLVVLNFYRGGWCPYCNFELNALQEMVPEFERAGAKLIAVSPEVPDHSLNTKEKNQLSFDILHDQGNQVAREFGLVFELPEALRPIYEKFGIDVVGHNGDETFELPIPATYIINQDGEIVYHFVETDYTQRAEPADVLAALKGYA
jgi:peroxiredoxin